MTITLNRRPRLGLGGSALATLIAFAFVPVAEAQRAPPWGAVFPGEIERSLAAQGYMLTAPLIRRPGVYLADVSAGPAEYQRLIIDARSGQVLERFPASRHMWGPAALADRDAEFGDFYGSGPGSAASDHIPAAVGPYGLAETRAGAEAKPKAASTDRKSIANAPWPPPAPREAAKVDRLDSAPQPTETHDSEPSGILSPILGDERPVSAPKSEGSIIEASDKPKVTIVPPALFQ